MNEVFGALFTVVGLFAIGGAVAYIIRGIMAVIEEQTRSPFSYRNNY